MEGYYPAWLKNTKKWQASPFGDDPFGDDGDEILDEPKHSKKKGKAADLNPFGDDVREAPHLTMLTMCAQLRLPRFFLLVRSRVEGEEEARNQGRGSEECQNRPPACLPTALRWVRVRVRLSMA